MKFYSFASLLFFLSAGMVQGQGSDPLLGTWKNSYNSELNINWRNSYGMFSGTYSSSTGAEGKYFIVGFSPVSASKNAPQPVSLSMLWKPVKGAKGTPDEGWTSSMTGQIVTDTSGNWIMEVFHSLNASTPLPAVEIQNAGRYVETLTFKRSSNDGAVASSPQARRMQQSLERVRKMGNSSPARTKNPLEGDWTEKFPTTYPSLKVSSIDETGLLVGLITQKGVGDKVVLGFTAPNAPAGDIQSLSFVFMEKDTNSYTCHSANGFLYQKSRLELTLGKSKAVPYASKYTAVQITEKAVFSREPGRNQNDEVTFPVKRNNFTNNGASEWTANFSVGEATPHAPVLKFGMDTGGNFSWVNSTQCTTHSCTDYGHVQFNPSTSPTFKWIDKTPSVINWGPWGKAMANLGSDYVRFNPSYQALRYNAKLITHFDETAQFDEFLWDGAFAFPANSQQMLAPTSNMLKNLIDNGQVKPDSGKVCMAFYFDPDSKSGAISAGAWDPSLADLSSKLTFKYEPYSEVPYLWCTPLKSFSIGSKQIASSGSYSFDTGSSALKGDSARMQQTLNYAQQVFSQTGKWPTMYFEMGLDGQGQTGRLELTADQYVQLIDEGEHAGEHVPQIQTLSGTPNLYLQGSTMMNYVYSVFWWDVHPATGGTYDLTAREVWFFNKKNGPQIIQKNKSHVVSSPQNRNRDGGLVYPNPARERVSVALNLREVSDVVVSVYSLRGEKIYEKKHYDVPQGRSVVTLDDLDYRKLRGQRQRPSAFVVVRKNGRTIVKRRVFFRQ